MRPAAPTLLSTADGGGGAAIAARRLHDALTAAGRQSTLAVRHREGGGAGVVLFDSMKERARGLVARRLAREVGQRNLRGTATWSDAHLGSVSAAALNRLPGEVFNLHWVNDGFVSLAAIAQLDRPLVWTLHDMWAFTGGCHYDGGCGRFVDGCGLCPQLKQPGRFDLSAINLGLKRRLWAKTNLRIVTPSRWLAGEVARSSLLGSREVRVIPNPLDLTRFAKTDRSTARRVLQIPDAGPAILFGAHALSDPRKGADLLAAAVRSQRERLVELGAHIVAFGRDPGVAAELGLPVTMLGTLRDEQTLALAYSACDLLALPSRQDNLPNILAEAGGCELPAVAFDAGGVGELVVDGVTGALVPAFDVAAYGRAIVALLEQPERRSALGVAARAHVAACCDPAAVAAAYGRLFDEAAAD